MPARDPVSIQYLGVRGGTHPCVYAMISILTSPYPCREITVVVKHIDGEDHEAVCFVVWGWVGLDVTIVPDGFGTHGGTGGWGLGLVLELIEFYGVVLKEQWVDSAVFERIANGRPTKSDLARIQQADPAMPSWPYWKDLFRSRFTGLKRISAAFRNAHAEQFPFWLLEPELLDEVRNVAHEPATAVFRAIKRLEIIIRNMGVFDPELVGVKLIGAAMDNDGPFAPKAATVSEKQAWAMLFKGAIGAFKNPQSHRDEQLTVEDAAGQILAVNTLLRKLKRDFPDQFVQQELDDEEDEDKEGELS